MATRTTGIPAAPAEPAQPECFVIMPISEPDGYEHGHFQRVYEDVLAPACSASGYRAVRADQIRETNLIHLDVLQRLLESPMVLCDLSSRNANVLFELGLRQAFDRPVVLVQEVGTPKIFDIAPLRFTEYRRARVYHQVIEDQKNIARAIEATRDAAAIPTGINSIVRLLALTRPAALPDVQEATRDPALQIIRAELDSLRAEIRRLANGWPLTTRSPTPDAVRLSVIIGEFGAKVRAAASLATVDAATAAELAAVRDQTLREMARYEERYGRIPESFRDSYDEICNEHNRLIQTTSDHAADQTAGAGLTTAVLR